MKKEQRKQCSKKREHAYEFKQTARKKEKRDGYTKQDKAIAARRVVVFFINHVAIVNLAELREIKTQPLWNKDM